MEAELFGRAGWLAYTAVRAASGTEWMKRFGLLLPVMIVALTGCGSGATGGASTQAKTSSPVSVVERAVEHGRSTSFSTYSPSCEEVQPHLFYCVGREVGKNSNVGPILYYIAYYDPATDPDVLAVVDGSPTPDTDCRSEAAVCLSLATGPYRQRFHVSSAGETQPTTNVTSTRTATPPGNLLPQGSLPHGVAKVEHVIPLPADGECPPGSVREIVRWNGQQARACLFPGTD